MNPWTTLYAPLIGRILLGGFFLWSGIEKVLDFPTYVSFFDSFGYQHYALWLAPTCIAIEVLLGIALVVDVKTRAVALLLSIYMIVVSFLFMSVGTTNSMQTFVENMAIVGGLLMAAAYGTSRWTPSWQR